MMSDLHSGISSPLCSVIFVVIKCRGSMQIDDFLLCNEFIKIIPISYLASPVCHKYLNAIAKECSVWCICRRNERRFFWAKCCFQEDSVMLVIRFCTESKKRDELKKVKLTKIFNFVAQLVGFRILLLWKKDMLND